MKKGETMLNKNLVSCLLLVTLLKVSFAQQANPGEVTFGVIADSHICGNFPFCKNSGGKRERFIKAVSIVSYAEADFVIHLGDHIEGLTCGPFADCPGIKKWGDISPIKDYMDMVQKYANPNCPYRLILGNHDIRAWLANPECIDGDDMKCLVNRQTSAKRFFREAAKSKQGELTEKFGFFDKNNWRFILLNSGETSKNPSDANHICFSDSQMDSLKNNLTSPSVLFWHCKPKDDIMEYETLVNAGKKSEAEKKYPYLKVISDNKDKIKAVFYGHVHHFDRFVWKGIPFFACGSTGFPTGYDNNLWMQVQLGADGSVKVVNKEQIAWSGENDLSVAMNNKGYCIEAHKGLWSNKQFFRVGKLGQDGKTITWGNSFTTNSTCTTLSLALDDEGRCIEVHRKSSCELQYRTGQLDLKKLSISWNKLSKPFTKGNGIAVALDNSGHCIEIHRGHDHDHKQNLYYQLGKVDFSNGTIAWHSGKDKQQYDVGSEFAVAMDGHGNCITIHRNKEGEDTRLYYHLGPIDFSKNNWHKNSGGRLIKYSDGFNADLALDNKNHCLQFYRNKNNCFFYNLGNVTFPKGKQNIVWVKTQQQVPGTNGSCLSVSMDDSGHCLLIYRGTEETQLYYRTGKLDSKTNIVSFNSQQIYDDGLN